MASSKEYLDYVLELCARLSGITYKKMMGEYLLYQDGVLFGGVYDNRFLLKKTDSTLHWGLKDQIPYPNAKPMSLVDIEDPARVEALILDVMADLR